MDKINLGSTIPAYPMPVSLVGAYVNGPSLLWNDRIIIEKKKQKGGSMADIKAYQEVIAELKEQKKMLDRFKKGEITKGEFHAFELTHDIKDLYRRIDELEKK